MTSSGQGQRTRRGFAAKRHAAPATRENQLSSGDTGPLHLLALIGSPVALGTGLMFYFGWIRAHAEAQAFGYDISVTGMSVQDFILKSIYVLYVPLLIPLLAAVALVWLHRRLVRAANHRAALRDSLVWFAGVLTMSWTIWLVLGIALLLFVPPIRLFVIPAAITMAVLCAIYGDQLRRCLHVRDRLPASVRALLLAVLIFAVFWDTERIAVAVGTAYAAQIGSNPNQLVAVSVYSPKNLDIAVPGVLGTRLGSRDSAYLYRYDGLRLLQLSGGHYFLISQRWDTAHKRVIVIPVSNSYRIEFSR